MTIKTTTFRVRSGTFAGYDDVTEDSLRWQNVTLVEGTNGEVVVLVNEEEYPTRARTSAYTASGTRVLVPQLSDRSYIYVSIESDRSFTKKVGAQFMAELFYGALHADDDDSSRIQVEIHGGVTSKKASLPAFVNHHELGLIPVSHDLSQYLEQDDWGDAWFGGSQRYVSPIVHLVSLNGADAIYSVQYPAGDETFEEQDFLKADISLLRRLGYRYTGPLVVPLFPMDVRNGGDVIVPLSNATWAQSAQFTGEHGGRVYLGPSTRLDRIHGGSSKLYHLRESHIAHPDVTFRSVSTTNVATTRDGVLFDTAIQKDDINGTSLKAFELNGVTIKAIDRKELPDGSVVFGGGRITSYDLGERAKVYFRPRTGQTLTIGDDFLIVKDGLYAMTDMSSIRSSSTPTSSGYPVLAMRPNDSETVVIEVEEVLVSAHSMKLSSQPTQYWSYMISERLGLQRIATEAGGIVSQASKQLSALNVGLPMRLGNKFDVVAPEGVTVETRTQAQVDDRFKDGQQRYLRGFLTKHGESTYRLVSRASAAMAWFVFNSISIDDDAIYSSPFLGSDISDTLQSDVPYQATVLPLSLEEMKKAVLIQDARPLGELTTGTMLIPEGDAFFEKPALWSTSALSQVQERTTGRTYFRAANGSLYLIQRDVVRVSGGSNSTPPTVPDVIDTSAAPSTDVAAPSGISLVVARDIVDEHDWDFVKNHGSRWHRQGGEQYAFIPTSTSSPRFGSSHCFIQGIPSQFGAYYEYAESVTAHIKGRVVQWNDWRKSAKSEVVYNVGWTLCAFRWNHDESTDVSVLLRPRRLTANDLTGFVLDTNLSDLGFPAPDYDNPWNIRHLVPYVALRCSDDDGDLHIDPLAWVKTKSLSPSALSGRRLGHVKPYTTASGVPLRGVTYVAGFAFDGVHTSLTKQLPKDLLNVVASYELIYAITEQAIFTLQTLSHPVADALKKWEDAHRPPAPVQPPGPDNGSGATPPGQVQPDPEPEIPPGFKPPVNVDPPGVQQPGQNDIIDRIRDERARLERERAELERREKERAQRERELREQTGNSSLTSKLSGAIIPVVGVLGAFYFYNSRDDGRPRRDGRRRRREEDEDDKD